MLPLLLATLLASPAQAAPIDRLAPDERDAFDALSVFLDAKQEKALLKLKTREARDAWLKAQGLYDRWWSLDAGRREEIAAGNVVVGFLVDEVLMALGTPFERRRVVVTGVQRAEQLVYRVEVTRDGRVLVWEAGSKETHNAQDRYRYLLDVHNGMVVAVTKKKGWE
jgi:hypothetical protein